MTEHDWLVSDNPAAMLEHLRIRHEPGGYYPVSDRKLLLFAQAWWRAILPHTRYQEECGALENSTEWLLDDCRRLSAPGKTGAEEVRRSGAALLREIVGNPWRPVALRWNDGKLSEYVRTEEKPGSRKGGRRGASWIEYDVWHHVDWLTPAAVAIARTMYEERRFEDCPILADALEDAGCPAEVTCPKCTPNFKTRTGYGLGWLSAGGGSTPTFQVGCTTCGGTLTSKVDGGRDGTGRVPNPLLAHLRTPGPHVRGCHAVDLILGLS